MTKEKLVAWCAWEVSYALPTFLCQATEGTLAHQSKCRLCGKGFELDDVVENVAPLDRGPFYHRECASKLRKGMAEGDLNSPIEM